MVEVEQFLLNTSEQKDTIIFQQDNLNESIEIRPAL